MSFQFGDAVTPAFVRGLTSLSAILDKAAQSGIAESELMEARLAPDMFPLPRQIQSVSDSAKGTVARLAGVEPPSMPDTEATLAELQERLAKTLDFVRSVDPAQFAGAEDREVVLHTPRGEMRFSGRDYLLGFGLPNFYFHITTAYGILRHKGVQIGKLDYLGAPQP